jgi:hypothetical protein
LKLIEKVRRNETNVQAGREVRLERKPAARGGTKRSVGVFPVQKSEYHDFQVEPKCPVFQIIKVAIDALSEIRIAPKSIDLGPSRNARVAEIPDIVMRNLRTKHFRVKRSLWARPDKAHVSLKHIPKLGNFIQVPPADESATPQKPRIIA